MLDEPDVVLIATRNDFEVVIGGLDGALDPGTTKLPAENRWGGTCVIFNERKTISSVVPPVFFGLGPCGAPLDRSACRCAT